MTTATEHQETPISEDVRPDVSGVPVIEFKKTSSDPHGWFYQQAPQFDVDAFHHPWGSQWKDDTKAPSFAHGDKFVRYEDHLRAVLNPMGHKLSRDMDSLYSVLQFILDNIADLEQSPEFAGFQAHRILNDEGDLLQITLTPCDKIDDITAPRMVNAEAPKVKAVKKPGLKLVDAKGGAL